MTAAENAEVPVLTTHYIPLLKRIDSQNDELFEDELNIVKQLSVPETQLNPKRPEYLSNEEIELIKHNSELRSSHINAFLTLLTTEFAEYGGLFRTEWGSTNQFPKVEEKKLIQLIHLPGHWVTVAGGFSDNADVVLYDSMVSDEPKQLHNFLLNNVSHLIGCKSSFTLLIAKPSRQPDSHSCGVYALAFATALAFGLDPEEENFQNARILRDHLKAILRQKEGSQFIPFPTSPSKRTKSRRNDIRKIKVCGICGGVHNFDSSNPMIQCDRCKIWFHRKCENIDEHLFEIFFHSISLNGPALIIRLAINYFHL